MYKFKFTAALTGIIIFSILNWNCTKIDTTDIGSDLIPAVDNVNTFAMEVPVIANNFDSLSTTPTSLAECAVIDRSDENVLGHISNDPYFGKTSASIFFQVLPPSTSFSFPVRFDSLMFDSVVLVMSYKRAYGDTLAPQRIIVQEVNATHTNFRADSFYTSCNTFTALTPVLGIRTYAPADLKNSNNQLRIKLSDPSTPAGVAFGQALINQDPATGFKNDSAFKAFFRGFAISADESLAVSNALSYFNLADTGTKLALYYRVKNRAGKLDTTFTNFALANTGATANKITRNRTGSEILQYLNNPAPEDSVIYIQSTPGNYALLQIPQLKSLGNRIIHRAELIMDQVYSPSSASQYLTPPFFLFLDVKDTGLNKFKAVPCDFSTATGAPNISSFGGFQTKVRDAFGNNIIRYVFNISRYTQAAVTKGQLDYTFRLRAPYNVLLSGYPSGYLDECNQFISPYNFGLNQVGYGGVKLGGGNNSNYKMKVRIIYSNIQ